MEAFANSDHKRQKQKKLSGKKIECNQMTFNFRIYDLNSAINVHTPLSKNPPVFLESKCFMITC